MIEVKNLKFKYQNTQKRLTLDDISFHVKQGEWFSIVGHNGSGKSTTARLLDGFLEPDSGDIIIQGTKLTSENVWELRRQIGMVFQNPDNQFVGATVEDDIAFGLENQGLPLEAMKERVTEVLTLVKMEEFKTREPSCLSGGQKQRIAIAGALALRPKILILDEATSMLDPLGRQKFLALLNRIRKEFQVTILSITHDLDEVALSDRVMVLKEGKCVSISSSKELLSKGDELLDFGLDVPFSMTVTAALQKQGLNLGIDYLTEEELEEHLWTLLSNR